LNIFQRTSARRHVSELCQWILRKAILTERTKSKVKRRSKPMVQGPSVLEVDNCSAKREVPCSTSPVDPILSQFNLLTTSEPIYLTSIPILPSCLYREHCWDLQNYTTKGIQARCKDCKFKIASDAYDRKSGDNKHAEKPHKDILPKLLLYYKPTGKRNNGSSQKQMERPILG